MNIFVLDMDPMKAAKYHNDKHVVKMILESAQLLCTAHWELGGEAPYKPTHKNHPCAIWTRQSVGNYRWLSELALNLCNEYSKRYGRTHKSQSVIEWCFVNVPKKLYFDPQYFDGEMTPFALAMPEQYHRSNPVQAYRAYYMGEKRHIANWKCGAPRWWK